MLSDDHRHRIEAEAIAKARALSDAELHPAAAGAHVDFRDAAPGDRRDELELVDRVYTLEMMRRGLTAK